MDYTNSSLVAYIVAVYTTLIKLCTDICQHNGKMKLLWSADKDKTLNYSPKSDEMVLTVHRWFANKSCPGDWLYARLGDLASKVTAALGSSASATSLSPYMVSVTIDNLNIRRGPGTDHDTVDKYTGKGCFTIAEEAAGQGASKWGLLKSSANKRDGWISLDFAAALSLGKQLYHLKTTSGKAELSLLIIPLFAAIECQTQREILRLHLIEHRSFCDIAELMGYSERQTYRIYKKALRSANLLLPADFSLADDG